MAEAIKTDFVKSWGSITQCRGFMRGGVLRSCTTGLTEKMSLSSHTGQHYCMVCTEQFSADDRRNFSTKLNDAKFKCPEGSCKSSLSFREFLTRACCTVALKNSKNYGLSSVDQKQRVEFQDLKKMMNLLELSDKEDREAKGEMDLREDKYDEAREFYLEKNKKQERSRDILITTFKNAEFFMNFTDEITQKFKELKILMDDHEFNVIEERQAEKKMESERAKYEEAEEDFLRKSGNSERLQMELSKSFTDAGQSLTLPQSEAVEKKERDNCNVCFEKYNTIDRHFCVLQCGHPTCQKCLTEMHEKLCPICREPFTENNIIKLFFN